MKVYTYAFSRIANHYNMRMIVWTKHVHESQARKRSVTDNTMCLNVAEATLMKQAVQRREHRYNFKQGLLEKSKLA
jgi:hypothetical protein